MKSRRRRKEVGRKGGKGNEAREEARVGFALEEEEEDRAVSPPPPRSFDRFRRICRRGEEGVQRVREEGRMRPITQPTHFDDVGGGGRRCCEGK